MPVPFTCQRVRVDNVMCSKSSKGFVIGEGESASAVYASGLALCTPCGEAVLETRQGSMFVTTAEIEEMMQEEGNVEQASTPPLATLHDLAAKFNQASADIPVEIPQEQEPSAPDVPKVDAPKPEGQPAVPSNKAAMLAVLRAEVEKARAEIAQTQQLLETMASLPDFAKQGLVNAIKTKEKEIAAHERQAAKLLEPPVKYYASKEMVALRHAIFNGGIEALRALDAAMAAGLLGKKSAKKAEVATSESQAVRVNQAEKVVQSRKENEERNAEIERLYREGKTEKEIRDLLGIPEANKGIVTGVVGRAVEAGRLVRHKKAA